MFYFSTKKKFLINFLKIFFSDPIEKKIFYLLLYYLLKNFSVKIFKWIFNFFCDELSERCREIWLPSRIYPPICTGIHRIHIGGKFSMFYFSTKKIFLINFLKIYFSDPIEKKIFYLLLYYLLKNIAI